MGKWFLSGGGDAHQTEQLDRHFARSICPHKPLLYIPIAMDADRYDDGFDWISRLFHPLGIKNIVMWTDVKGKTVHDLDVFSAVYIGGGNTFRLLKQFIESHFTAVLKRYAESGGAIYGGSAGAVILGKNIMTCSYMDRNACGLRDFNGLKLLGDYSVWCHYKAEHDPLIKGLGMLLALPSSPCQRKQESQQALQTSGSSEQSPPVCLKKTAQYSSQINLFYKAKTLRLISEAFFLFCGCKPFDQAFRQKNTAKPKPSKRKIRNQRLMIKIFKSTISKSITAQKIKAARQAASSAFSFWVCIFKNITTPPRRLPHPNLLISFALTVFLSLFRFIKPRQLHNHRSHPFEIRSEKAFDSFFS